MNEVKCECGHINHVGTSLCESCGKPFIQIDKLIDMKYDGVARRSTTYKKTIVDKSWNFFSSVKVGIWLIVLILLASGVGTIFPQKDFISTELSLEQFYQQEYGFFGSIYYKLGFNDLYRSWWFILLVAMLGMSLVICSIDRAVPLYKALKNQRVTKHKEFLRRQRLFSISHVEPDEIEQMKVAIIQKKYHIREENGDIFAEKGRFSRWGPYVNHVGLIIFLMGVMLRAVPGMYVDEVLWIRENETKEIPGTNGLYYLTNHSFLYEVYDKEIDNQLIPKNFQTNVILLENKNNTEIGTTPQLSFVEQNEIQVNKPLKFEGFALYQVDYKLQEFYKMNFLIEDVLKESIIGEISIDLSNPKSMYELNNEVKVTLVDYFPDFQFDSKGEPSTKTKVPNNPAFVFSITSPEITKSESNFVAIQKNISSSENNRYQFVFNNVETRNASALTVRKDRTLWILGLGGFVFMVGVIQGMYWQHRRIWIQMKGEEIWIAAFTNKNWYSLQRELADCLKDTSFNAPIDQMK